VKSVDGMGEISGPDDTGSERTSHLPGVLVIQWALPASHMRENGEGQCSRRHQGPIDDGLSCFDRVLRTARQLGQKTQSRNFVVQRVRQLLSKRSPSKRSVFEKQANVNIKMTALSAVRQERNIQSDSPLESHH